MAPESINSVPCHSLRLSLSPDLFRRALRLKESWRWAWTTTYCSLPLGLVLRLFPSFLFPKFFTDFNLSICLCSRFGLTFHS
ncbi:hypothetical protein BO85DRAFT_304406 [Aspergillus piperis CBS 112811]|uniref:Uncharacterized protein n=1 Tax=Aspergillus piperis CBS 112811 TaxID=1448313 RepID=A0A8G1R2L5_9EURO|nr:hypothetical protein BO85DRAFT_304406 [Aspergillus piperis CBS 112811]RAH57511.1 hypothetical protein BO85DRAFT_304406 [Aspergillus piperis CBS 112811]